MARESFKYSTVVDNSRVKFIFDWKKAIGEPMFERKIEYAIKTIISKCDGIATKYDGGFWGYSYIGDGIDASSKIKGVNGKPVIYKYKEIYPNGDVAKECVYLEFLDEGKVKIYYEDGKLYRELNYKNFHLDGENKSFYRNGILRSDCIYNDGKLWETIADNMPDGKPTGTKVKKGTGKVEQYYDDGKKEMDINFVHTKNRMNKHFETVYGGDDCYYKCYYENGILRSDYHFMFDELWSINADNMSDGKPSGTYFISQGGIIMNKNAAGTAIIGKKTYKR
jgi:antitoxin component YwqK of YwqJK toxin-antitoxin module